MRLAVLAQRGTRSSGSPHRSCVCKRALHTWPNHLGHFPPVEALGDAPLGCISDGNLSPHRSARPS